MSGYIPGYVATITVNGVEHAPDTISANLTQSRNLLDKTKLGSDRIHRLSGLGDSSVALQLHMNTATMVALMAAYEAVDPIAVVIRPGALASFDAGQWTGTGLVSSFEWAGDADGEWDVSMQIDGDNGFTYTAPA